MSEIQLKPTFARADDRWPILVSATYGDSDAVRFYSPDGGTDVGVTRAGAKDELVRRMHGMLLVYERNLRERGVVLSPPDWGTLMMEAGVDDG